MAIFRAIFLTALMAGILAGLVVTAFQATSTLPLIQRGEVYEQAAEASAPAMEGHDHGEAAWEPTPGLERNGLTFLANLLTGVGFGLLLTALYAVRGRVVSWRDGLLWGLAGFAVFSVAPDLGLPPELPGMPASALGPRQAWWIATALATAAGLGLVFLQRRPWLCAIGLVLLLAPHLWGAPAPLDEPTNVPESLAHSFVVAVTLSTFLFWIVLGTLTGALFGRFSGGRAAAEA